MGLTTCMEKWVVSVQMWIKCVSIEGDVVEFFSGEGMCWRPLGFATTSNMWDLVGCLEHDSLHHHPQPLSSNGFGFVTTSLRDCQVQALSEHFLRFSSCGSMVQSGHFLCIIFCMYFGLGSSFNSWFVSSMLVLWLWVIFNLGFRYGLGRSKFRVTIWHGNEEDQDVYTWRIALCLEADKAHGGSLPLILMHTLALRT